MDAQERLSFEGWARLPQFQRKVEQAKQIIKEALAIAPAYVAVSWGKDSTVLLHLCQQEQPDILAVHVRTPHQELLNDYERVIYEYQQQFPTHYQEFEIDLETLMPAATQALKLWENNPVALIGIRAEENPKKRGSQIKKFGLLSQYKSGARAGSWRCWAIGRWTWQDVWAYTVLHDLPYLSSYDHPQESGRDRSRTTNIMPFTPYTATHRHGRIEKMKAISPEAYAFLKKHYPEFS